MKRFFAMLLCLCLVAGLLPISARAADRHSIMYDYTTLPTDQLVFQCGETAVIPFKLYRGSQASSYERYYIYIVNSNGGKEFELVEDFKFGSAYIINLSTKWTVTCEPGIYTLEYYDSTSSSVGHKKIPIKIEAVPGEHIQMNHTKKQQAVLGYPNQATSAWINTAATYQRWSFDAPIAYELQLKEMYIGKTAQGIAYSEFSLNEEPTDSQQWIFMKFHLKNCGTEELEADDIIYEDRFYTSTGSTFKVFDTATLGGSREPYGVFDVKLFPGASSDVWIGILANKADGFPLMQLYCGYSNGKNTYAWVDTNPFPSEVHIHSYTLLSEVKATCYDSGMVTSGCACGYVFSSVTKPLGHNMKDGVCTRCGYDLPFEDIKPTDWYYSAVKFAVTEGLFNGTSKTKFSPNTTMTRAMLVTVLWRFAGQPKDGQNTFGDVPADQYYTDAVAWASANNVVNGVGKNRFNPNGVITREQMATILFRYAEANGLNTELRGDLNSFSDGNKVSGYAKDAMSWAVGMGLINGSKGRLDPQGGATRAQVAAILMRYIEGVISN